MKNVINFLVVVLVLVATEIQAYDKYTIGGRTWEYDINNSSAEIVSVSPEPKNGEDIVIPKKINGYPVKTIGSRMGVQGTFGNCDGITRFEIPEFITRIDSCALQRFSQRIPVRRLRIILPRERRRQLPIFLRSIHLGLSRGFSCG